MSEDIETRRRRALWRASHRGTKELDLVIGGFAAARLAGMEPPELARFEAFLLVEEPKLQDWLLSPEGDGTGEFAELVAEMRRFHGLD
jgi:antitoxin CptB